MEEIKKIYKIRVEAINLTGLYTKNAMVELYKYMNKRKKTTIWILTETHFTKGSELNFKSVYERSFYAFSKRRSWEQRKKHKISKKPSGGVAILCRKDIEWKTPPNLIEQYTEEGLLTVKLEINKEKFIISGVYLVPESSKLFENNKLIWESLSVMLNTERQETIKLIT